MKWQLLDEDYQRSYNPNLIYASLEIPTWWLIPHSKWVITPVINGISRFNPLITGVITHLLSAIAIKLGLSAIHL